MSKRDESSGGEQLTSDVGQRVVWNKATGAFELQSRVPHHQAPLFIPRRYTKEPAPVHQQPVRFDASLPSNVLDDLDLGDMQHAKWSLEQFRATRIQVYDQILAAASRLILLLRFVAKWRTALAVCKEHLMANQAGDAKMHLVCQEFLELAQAFKLLGEIADAREALGQCISLIRQLLLDDRDRFLKDAKREFLACIHFQEVFAGCEMLLRRQKTPPSILAHLQRQIDWLAGQAPFSVKIWTIKTNLHLKANQFPTVVSNLSLSPLTATDEFFTMAYTHALEMVGAYTQSLDAAQVFLASEHCSQSRDVSATETKLRAHAKRLESILERKRQAEQLEREGKYRDAEKCYEECLELVGHHSNNRFTAELLYRRANLVVMDMAPSMDRLIAAIQDLTLSRQLWPANQLLTLCLETAQLHLETKKLRCRMRKENEEVDVSVTHFRKRFY
uniref:Uncharacterized protein n=1 Tax=Globisporangium ultimum (strain ATCC 200006 / CBS 805.95 / DAOM BR144) TaxID=431595 RepID=K3X216_GLOUD